MTGAELIKWIQDHHAEELEIFCATFEGGLVTRIVPEVVANQKIRGSYAEARDLPDGWSVVL